MAPRRPSQPDCAASESIGSGARHIATISIDNQLRSLLDRKNWWIAYSGGVDSTVLLHLAAHFLEQLKNKTSGTSPALLPRLYAVHIDHQLQEASAAWAQHCVSVSEAMGVECVVRGVRVNAEGQGVEAAARKARYQAMANIVEPNDVLMTAHHANDQAETILLRLLRGAGLKGAAGMASQRAMTASNIDKPDVILHRPLLAVDREQVLAYATEHRLHWVDDPSNEVVHYDRNWVRQRVLPLLKQRWPATEKKLVQFALQAREGQELLDELAAIDLDSVDAGRDRYGNNLSVTGLRDLSDTRFANVVRYWLAQLGVGMPTRAMLHELVRQCRNTDADNVQTSCGVTVRWGDHSLRMHRLRLYLVDATLWQHYPHGAPHEELHLSAAGSLKNPYFGELDVRVCADTSAVGLAEGNYALQFRQRGQKCLVHGQHRTLKNVLNENAVPSWLRDRCPLLVADGHIAAVGDFVICDGFRVDGGWQLHWQPVPQGLMQHD